MRLRATLAQVVGNPAMRRLELAWIIAIAAEKAYLVALLVHAHAVGGVLAVGVFTLLASLPAGIFGPVLASAGEAFAPARLLLGLHAVRAVVVGAAAAVVVLDGPMGLLVAAVIAEGILTRQHTATTRAMLPALSRTPDELIAGNAVTSLGEGIGSFLGPAVAAALLLVGGPALGLASAAIAYVAASIIVLGIRVAPMTRPEAGRGALKRLLEILGGFTVLAEHREAALLIGLFICQVVVRGLLTVLIVSAAIDLLGIGESGVGSLNATIGAGGLIGAVVAMGVVVAGGLSASFTISLAMWGAPIAVIGLVPNAPLAFVMAAIIGAANAAIDVAGYTLLARCVPNEVRGRVFGLLQSLVGIGVALGALLAPLLVTLFELRATLIITGLILPVVAVLGYRGVRRAEDATVLPQRELAILRRMPMFAPLPLTSLELLARSLVQLEFAAGERIITQGERGDCYYMIESGEVEIIHDDHRETTLGAGDGFGEIALLSDRPRTATVAATEPVVAFRLPREAFLEAVTGSEPSASAAEALASRRLAELRH